MLSVSPQAPKVAMTIKDQMERIYGELALERIPWNNETLPGLLAAAVTARVAKAGRVVDLGCGAGNYVLALARMGYDVTGVDIAENAIAVAREAAARANLACRFVAADLLGEPTALDDGFDLAYDWELLHHIFPADRERYLRNVSRLVKPGRTYVSVSFSEDDPQFGGAGKYRATQLGTILYFSSEAEIAALLAGHFTVESLETVDIPGRHGVHRAVYAVATRKVG